MFTGYCDKTLDFLWGIRLNNDRAWFTEHKDDYLQYLYQPTMDLGNEVYARFMGNFPSWTCPPRLPHLPGCPPPPWPRAV